MFYRILQNRILNSVDKIMSYFVSFTVSCPVGTNYYDSCYVVIDNQESNWTAATDQCYTNTTGELGYLTSIRNQQELEFIHWEIVNSGITTWETVYTGMTYHNQTHIVYGDEGQYLLDTGGDQWIDGGPWATGYPTGDEYPCVGLVYDYDYYRWRFADVDCDVDRPFICGMHYGKTIIIITSTLRSVCTEELNPV